jgi:alpha-1,2-mannosyltransferase
MSQDVLDPASQAREAWERQIIRWLVLLALAIWLAAWISVCVLIHKNWKDRNECALFQESAQKWWDHQSLYEPIKWIDGFLYLPQSVVIYSPFAAMGHPAGDIAWRLFGLLLLTTGMWRLSYVLSPKYGALIFAIASYIAVAPSLGSLRNGQPNMHISGIMLHTAVELSRRRLWAAAILLLVGLAIKPIIFVMVLLVMALYPAIIWRSAVVAGVLAIVPYIGQNAHYVNWQYQQFWEKLSVAEAPTRAFCDFRGIFWTFGWIMPVKLYTFIQMFAAGGTLLMCFVARMRHREPFRAIYLAALAAVYLMLFNPRTESNSYVILEPYIAIPAAMMFFGWKRPLAGIFLIFLSVLMFCDGWAYHATENWLKAITCIVYSAFLAREIFRADSASAPQPPQDHEIVDFPRHTASRVPSP